MQIGNTKVPINFMALQYMMDHAPNSSAQLFPISECLGAFGF